MEFHHLGVATRTAAELAGRYADLFDTAVAHEEWFEGMRVVFLDVDGGYLELLEPHEGGPVADYLDTAGPGVHHVALATPDVADALARVREAGVEPVDEKPRPGAWGHEVAFLHPESTGGVLIELVGAGAH